LHETESPCSPAYSPWEGSNEFLDDSEVSIDSVDVVNKSKGKLKTDQLPKPLNSLNDTKSISDVSDPMEGTSSCESPHGLFDDFELSIDNSDVVRSNVVKFKTNLAVDQYEEVFLYTEAVCV
jgi:hypothetical protein